MIKDRYARPLAMVTGLVILCAVPGLARDQSDPTGVVQAQGSVSPRNPSMKTPDPENDFEGLNYTEEQKAEIDKIHRDTESRKAVVMKDDKLTPDQKDAMRLGYTRMEYGMTFKVLSPEQQKQVRMRIQARRGSEQTANKPSLPSRN